MNYLLSWWEFKDGHWGWYSKKIDDIPSTDLLEVAQLIYEKTHPEFISDITIEKK